MTNILKSLNEIRVYVYSFLFGFIAPPCILGIVAMGIRGTM
jgi:hypothetical protein